MTAGNLGEHLSNTKIPGWLGYKRDYTTQLLGDYTKPFQGSPLNNQYLMESIRGFFSWLTWDQLKVEVIKFQANSLGFSGFWRFFKCEFFFCCGLKGHFAISVSEGCWCTLSTRKSMNIKVQFFLNSWIFRFEL